MKTSEGVCKANPSCRSGSFRIFGRVNRGRAVCARTRAFSRCTPSNALPASTEKGSIGNALFRWRRRYLSIRLTLWAACSTGSNTMKHTRKHGWGRAARLRRARRSSDPLLSRRQIRIDRAVQFLAHRVHPAPVLISVPAPVPGGGVGHVVCVEVEYVALVLEQPGFVVVANFAVDSLRTLPVNDRVVHNGIVGGDMRAVGAVAPVLLNDANAVAAVAGDLHGISVDGDVARVLKQDLRSPHPRRVAHRVVAHHVVPDRRRVADFVLDSRAAHVIHNGVVLIQGVDAVHVAPQPGARVVVHEVASHDEPVGLRKLSAAGVPGRVKSGPIIKRDLIALDEDVLAAGSDSFLPVVMNEVADRLAAVAQVDAGAMIPAQFVINHQPVRARILITDCAELARHRILLNNQRADRDVACRARECAAHDADLDLVTGRVVRKINFLIGVVEKPCAWSDRAEVGNMKQRPVVEIKVFGVRASGMPVIAETIQLSLLTLVINHPERAFPAKICQKGSAAKSGSRRAYKRIAVFGTNHLQAENAAIEGKGGAGRVAIDGRLNVVTRRQSYLTECQSRNQRESKASESRRIWGAEVFQK